MARFFRPKTAAVFKPSDLPLIDQSKNYDVYTSHSAGRMLVYRNVLIRGVKRIVEDGEPSFVRDAMLELQQANGQTIYVTRFAIHAVCEHGTDLHVERFRPA